MDQADVAVRHHCFDFEPPLSRHHDQQGLSRRDHAAYGVNGELPNDAINRRGQDPQFGALLGLDTPPAVPPV
jgi:hypothetical protein